MLSLCRISRRGKRAKAACVRTGSGRSMLLQTTRGWVAPSLSYCSSSRRSVLAATRPCSTPGWLQHSHT